MCYENMSASLKTELGKIKLNNPTILASGILGVSGKLLKRVAESGAGAITTKSIGKEPRSGHANPTVLEFGYGIINAVGLSNPGYEKFKEEIKIAKEGKVPVIASIFAGNPEEFAFLAKEMEDAKADAIELNISCPNIMRGEVIGEAIGKDPDLCYDVVKAVKKAVGIPVIAKLTPNVNDIKLIAKSVEEAGSDAISAINTLGPGMLIDVETAKPILANKFGGLSGPAIRPIAIRCVYEIYETVKIPIIGIGGIMTGKDAIEMMMAGASAIGIGSGIYYRGLDVFKKVCDEIREFLESHEYSNLKEIVGIAHRD
jgi:dihydroorotate dehydrogenase (NAD+) catalytic subunit